MSILSDIAKEEYKMEMTPMIDVTFLLLIFFLLTLKFKILEGKLAAYLPKDVGNQTTSSDVIEKVEIKLTVLEAGTKMDPQDPTKPWNGETRFEYVGRKIRYHVGPQKTEDVRVLKERIQRLYDQAKRTGETRPMTIDARKGICYKDVIQVLDAAVEIGFEDITFVGEFKE
jgi:biopolymer transport protein ExbD